VTKTEYKKTIAQRLIVSLKGVSDFGEVTKFDEDGFSVLWNGETHSGNYSYKELEKQEDGALFVAEKRMIKTE
jgi:hypothetical protein